MVGCDLSNCNQPCNSTSDCGVARVRQQDNNRMRLISAQCRDSQCVMVATPLHLPVCADCERECLLKTDGSIFKCVGKPTATPPSPASVYNTTLPMSASYTTFPQEITKTTESSSNQTKFHTVENLGTEVTTHLKQATTTAPYGNQLSYS